MWIIGGVILMFLVGACVSMFYAGKDAGRTECQVEIAAAESKLAAKAKQYEDEAANHLTDMEAAFEAGESQSKVIYKTITAKGAKDVQTYPVFSDPKCTLPPESLRNLNAARSNLRTTQGDAKGAPESSQTPPNAPLAAPGATSAPQTPPTPANAPDKRPLGKRP